MRTSRLAVLASLLTAGLIAGCGSSSQGTATAKPAAATVSSSSSGAAGASSSSAALITAKHAKLGTVLAYGPRHMTVYLFESDSSTHSTCSGQCAGVWPPVTGRPRAGSGAVAADLGTIKRSDGTVQVTYKGHPLYGFVKDKDGGDAYGQGLRTFGSAWYVLAPSGTKIATTSSAAAAPTTTSSSSSAYAGGGNGY